MHSFKREKPDFLEDYFMHFIELRLMNLFKYQEIQEIENKFEAGNSELFSNQIL